jgi:hypothetical protein
MRRKQGYGARAHSGLAIRAEAARARAIHFDSIGRGAVSRFAQLTVFYS